MEWSRHPPYAEDAKMAPTKISYCYQCVGCDTYAMQPVGRTAVKGNSTKFQPGRGPVVPENCPNCGWHFNMGGPFWSEPIHDQAWVSEIKKQVEDNKAMYPGYDKIHALLTTVSEELPDCPLHYDIHSMSQCLKVREGGAGQRPRPLPCTFIHTTHVYF